jgi:CRP/FNR family transcriptional regulator
MRDQVIDAFPFLRNLAPKSREVFLAQGVRMRLEHKKVLARDGKECVYLPLVLEGTLRVYISSETGKELTLYRIERGESCILTATCILNGGSFPAIAEAEGQTDVFLVPAKLLVRLVEEAAEWRRFIFGLYAKRLEIVLTMVEEVAFHHIDSRIAAHLARSAADKQQLVSTTHGEIAAELGTSREVVTRILKDLEADGLIETLRGKIRILRPVELRERAIKYSAV